MAVVAFTSISGAAGVTAATLACAVHWPRPTLVLEADTNAVGSMLTGFFRSNLDTDLGMQKLGLAQSRGALDAHTLIEDGFRVSIAVHALPPVPDMPIPALPAGHRMWVVPGYLDLQAADGAVAVWRRLPRVFADLDEFGIDVLIDLGRIGRDDPRTGLLDAADQIVVVASSTMTDLNRLDKRLQLEDFAHHVDRAKGFGVDRYGLLLVNASYESVPSETFDRLVLPVLSTVAFDPAGAAVFGHGREDRKPKDNRYRIGIRRAVTALTERLAASHTERTAS
jgi:hypothetical protein